MTTRWTFRGGRTDAAFRIIVLNVRGKVIFFEIDSDRTPTQDPELLADAMKIIHSLKFPRP